MGKKRKIHFEKELLKQILKGRKLKIKKLCEETGLYYETILYAMKTGEIMPDLLETIAEYLDIDFYYLTGETIISDHYDQGQEKTLYKTGSELFAAWLETIKPLVVDLVMDENEDVMKRSFHSYPWSDFENDFNELSRTINNENEIDFITYLQSSAIDALIQEKNRMYNTKKAIDAAMDRKDISTAYTLGDLFFKGF